MCFLKHLYFGGCLEEDDYKKFDCLRITLVDEFQDHDLKKLRIMLGILDDLYISFRTQEFSCIVDKVKLLREDIFQIIKGKLMC